MVNLFLIHGAYGSPNENWFPWLAQELEKQGHTVFVPHFPTPDGQSLLAWQAVFKRYEKEINDKTIFVGHSLGVAFILYVLEFYRVKAAFFVSGFIGKLGKLQFDRINRTFTERAFAWEKIKRNCHQFVIFHSDNDPYVPWEKAEELGKHLGINVTEVKGAGHFNQGAGYKKFDLLLQKLEWFIKW